MPNGAVGGKDAGLDGWDGYGWYLGLVFHVVYLFLVLPLPLPFLSLPFPLLGFLRGGCERMSAMVTGSWRISSVACLKVMLLRICMAMVHENVSQASLTLARRCGFLRVSWMNLSMYVSMDSWLEIWMRIHAHRIASKESRIIIMD